MDGYRLSEPTLELHSRAWAKSLVVKANRLTAELVKKLNSYYDWALMSVMAHMQQQHPLTTAYL